LTSGRRPVVKIIAKSSSQHDEKHVVSAPLSGIRIGRRRRMLINCREPGGLREYNLYSRRPHWLST
jgi:hypothetical protein